MNANSALRAEFSRTACCMHYWCTLPFVQSQDILSPRKMACIGFFLAAAPGEVFAKVFLLPTGLICKRRLCCDLASKNHVRGRTCAAQHLESFMKAISGLLEPWQVGLNHIPARMAFPFPVTDVNQDESGNAAARQPGLSSIKGSENCIFKTTKPATFIFGNTVSLRRELMTS